MPLGRLKVPLTIEANGELRLYGIALLPSRPRDMLPLWFPAMSSATFWSMQLCSKANSRSLSITEAYTMRIAPGINVGTGLGYTDHPTPVVYTLTRIDSFIPTMMAIVFVTDLAPVAATGSRAFFPV